MHVNWHVYIIMCVYTHDNNTQDNKCIYIMVYITCNKHTKNVKLQIQLEMNR